VNTYINLIFPENQLLKMDFMLNLILNLSNESVQEVFEVYGRKPHEPLEQASCGLLEKQI
jgi:hypothetical protein